MTRNSYDKKTRTPVEMRFRLDAEDAADIAAIARTSGLATSTFIRTLVKNYLNKTYGRTV